jgi:hypothetical protein
MRVACQVPHGMVTVEVPHPDHVGVVHSVITLSVKSREGMVSKVFNYQVTFKELKSSRMVTGIVDIVYTHLSEVSV